MPAHLSAETVLPFISVQTQISAWPHERILEQQSPCYRLLKCYKIFISFSFYRQYRYLVLAVCFAHFHVDNTNITHDKVIQIFKREKKKVPEGTKQELTWGLLCMLWFPGHREATRGARGQRFRFFFLKKYLSIWKVESEEREGDTEEEKQRKKEGHTHAQRQRERCLPSSDWLI